MPASAFTPDLVIEIAFGSGYATPAASRSWTDVSAYVEAEHGLSITRGRSDEFSDVSPSRLTVTLDNRDGQFTPLYASGAYYPNVVKGTPIRVTATWAAVTYRRFTGYVDEWPVTWPQATSGSSTVTVTASSRLARLGRTAELTNIVSQEILADEPIAYYTLGDPAGSLQAVNSAATAQQPLRAYGDGDAPVFGNATGPGTDGLTAVDFASTSATDLNQYLVGNAPTSATVTDFTLEAWINGSAFSSVLSDDYFVDLYPNAFGFYKDTGIPAYHFRLNVSTTLDFPTSGIGDAETHHIAVTRSGSALTLYLDGVSVDTATDSNSLTLGRLQVGQYFDGAVAHVAFYTTGLSAARILAHYTAGVTGFEGEPSDAWVTRLAGYGGVPVGEVSAETGNTTSIAFVDTTGKAIISELLDVVHTENGLLFDAGDGTLTFHSRGHRYNATSVLTLAAASQQIEADIAPKLDDFGLINDCTVTTPSGYTTRVVDSASVDANGIYSDSRTLLYTSDYEADDAANYCVASYATPQVRVPNVSVQLTLQSSSQVTAILATELGSLITISGLPTQAPASSMTFFVEGYTETIGAEGQGWVWTANLSPGAIPANVWTVEDAVFGQYDAYGLAF